MLQSDDLPYEEEKTRSAIKDQGKQATALSKILFSNGKPASSSKVIVPKEDIKFAGRPATTSLDQV